MRRLLISVFLFFLIITIFPLHLKAEDYLIKADELFNKGGLDNYKKSIPLYLKALEENPDNYDSNWKCARAHREYAEDAMNENISGWKEINTEYGKIGMKYSEKAISINPNKPDAYYYYSLSVGAYSNGVGIINAIKEGLKNKLLSNAEKAYELDKSYLDGGPPIVLGRFWSRVPWPFRDKEKAMKYFKEYQAITKYKEAGDARRIYLAEFLLDIGGEANEIEAKALLELASQNQNKSLRDKANSMLVKIK